jgi:hypothetical protein
MGIRYQTRKILIPVIFSLLVFVCMDLILAGILIRSADRSFRTSHPYYHHGLIPGQRALASWNNINYPVFTNSMGFRDSLIRDIPLKTGRRRILFMGDSHTEGVGLRFEDTFTGQITSRLDPEEYEILNGAAVSYSPRIYYLKTKYLIEERGLEFDELFVFIDISDIQNEIVYRDFNPRHPGLFGRWRFSAGQVLVNRSYTVNTLGKLRQAAVTRKFIEKTELFDEYRSADVQVDALDLYASFFSGFDDKTLLSNPMFHGVAEWMYDPDFVELARLGLDLGRDNMQRLHDLCVSHGIKMTICVHPWQEQIRIGETHDLYVEYWKAFAKENQTGFINLYPVFIDPPVSAIYGIEFFLPDDNHWNRNGHWLAANEILKHIKK